METLCANSLAEVGVAVGDFVEALEASRLSQDISTAVYQQLVALDDFVTFKKLMVRYRAQNAVGFPHLLADLTRVGTYPADDELFGGTHTSSVFCIVYACCFSRSNTYNFAGTQRLFSF